MMHAYIDIGVHAFPEGADTLKRLNLVAYGLGFSQIVVTAHSPHWSQFPDSSLPLGVEIVAATVRDLRKKIAFFRDITLSLIHISEPTRLGMISYAVFCLKKK